MAKSLQIIDEKKVSNNNFRYNITQLLQNV